VDSSGNAYVTGRTYSTNFPTPFAYDAKQDGPSDAFVAKLNTALPGTSSLVDFTYLGGNSEEIGYGIAVDGSGAYVAGYTASSNFPTTLNASDRSFNGGDDAFVAKLIDFGQPPHPLSLAPVLVPVDGAGSAGEESIATTIGDGEVPVQLSAPTS